MNRVFVVSNSGHDFSPARVFGDIAFLSSGPIGKFNTDTMQERFLEELISSGPGDYIIPCGMNIMNIVACSIFSDIHHRLNLLIFDSNSKCYKPQNIYF